MQWKVRSSGRKAANAMEGAFIRKEGMERGLEEGILQVLYGYYGVKN
jgi:hypothetical protein